MPARALRRARRDGLEAARCSTASASWSAVAAAGLARCSQLSYFWQEYLPRLPLMDDAVPGMQPWSLWFKGLVGRFGWLDYGYPSWAYGLALLIVGGDAVIVRRRRRCGTRRRRGARGLRTGARGPARRRRGGLLSGGAAVRPGALPAAAAAAVRARPGTGGAAGRGPSWRPLLVLAAIGFSVFAQLLTVARYYG